jgi:thioredoxin-like negative regulator of GroEL
MSIPTLMLFKNGQVATQMVGAMAKAQLLDKINGAL